MTTVGALILVGVVVAFILAPVIQNRRASLEREDDELTEAQAARRVALLALRDVEYDYHTGKLDEKDYREVKRQLSAEALAAMSALEEEGSRDTLETEIAEMRQGLRAGLVCETCGFRNPGGSRFCGACGTALEPSPTPAESA
jgi:flagellar biosynthesis/type III secretory pathway M-ring protein FliF/YscJ